MEGPTRFSVSWEWQKLGMLGASIVFSRLNTCVSLQQVYDGQVNNTNITSELPRELLG